MLQRKTPNQHQSFQCLSVYSAPSLENEAHGFCTSISKPPQTDIFEFWLSEDWTHRFLSVRKMPWCYCFWSCPSTASSSQAFRTAGNSRFFIQTLPTHTRSMTGVSCASAERLAWLCREGHTRWPRVLHRFTTRMYTPSWLASCPHTPPALGPGQGITHKHQPHQTLQAEAEPYISVYCHLAAPSQSFFTAYGFFLPLLQFNVTLKPLLTRASDCKQH